jgi:hypothetical protein
MMKKLIALAGLVLLGAGGIATPASAQTSADPGCVVVVAWC